MGAVVQGAHAGVVAGCSHHVLGEVVAADREEGGAAEQLRLDRHGRHFHHHPERWPAGRQPLGPQVSNGFIQQGAGRVQFGRQGHHWQQDAQVSLAGRPGQGPQLHLKQGGMGEGEAQAPAAEERVRLLGKGQPWNGFVAAGIEGADRHRLAIGPLQDPPVGLELLVFPGQPLAEQKFAAHQPDAVAAARIQASQLFHAVDVELQVDCDAIARPGRSHHVGIPR